jgi:hypothetical protein
VPPALANLGLHPRFRSPEEPQSLVRTAHSGIREPAGERMQRRKTYQLTVDREKNFSISGFNNLKIV